MALAQARRLWNNLLLSVWYKLGHLITEHFSALCNYFISHVGETFKSLRLQYRIGTSTISQIIMETCAALHRVMKKDFLKVSTSGKMDCPDFPQCNSRLEILLWKSYICTPSVISPSFRFIHPKWKKESLISILKTSVDLQDLHHK